MLFTSLFSPTKMENHLVEVALFTVLPFATYVAVRWAQRSAKKNSLSLPPGPRPLPLIGNILSINASEPWTTYVEWGRQYGDIVYCNLLGQGVVVLNSEKAAKDLLEGRSQKYSSRPEIAANKLFGWEWNTALMTYGDTWRQHRRLFHHAFRMDAVEAYQPIQLQKTQQFLINLLDAPSKYSEHIHTLTASILMYITYGYDADAQGDHRIKLLVDAIDPFVQAITPEKTAILITFPFIKYLPTWFPGAYISRAAAGSRKQIREIQDIMFDFVKRSIASGSDVPSLTSDLLKQIDDISGTQREEMIKAVATTAFAAGVETTFSTLSFFMLYMVLHPEVQMRAQAEIDEVVDNGRLPNFGDRPSLPYVEAVLRETLRCNPAIPLGLPRATTEDDIYNGYLIPKGTTIIPNVWAMTNDAHKYADPRTFNPSRYFKENGQLNDDNFTLTFGFGRRICPGRHLADGSLWAVIVSILAAFNISKAKDDNGNDIDFVPQFTSGQATHPVPFPCSITPRSTEKERLVRLAT